MYEEKIADSGDDDRLVCTGRETGDDTSSEKRWVPGGSHSDYGTNHTKSRRCNKHWSFAPFGGESGDEWSSRADNEEVVSGNLSHLCQGFVQFNRELN